MKHFGKKLKEYREKAGLSQGQLAKMLGMLPSNYNPIETGKKRAHLDDKSLEKIAAIEKLADVGLTLNKMKAWRLVDLYGDEVVLALFEDYINTDERTPEIMALIQELESRHA